MDYSLIRHPSSPIPAIESIGVSVGRVDGSRLRFCYRVVGDISSIVMSVLMAPERADELWMTTCFEAFIQRPGQTRYAELNFSPSTRWAGYIFEDYRAQRRDFSNSTLPRIDLAAGIDSFELVATIDIAGNVDEWRDVDLWLGLSAVIETRDGHKSYWALAHPPGEPDFHQGYCFTGILKAPDEA
jgi:hypothetical protein